MISIKKQSIDGLENWETNLNGLTTHTKLERLGGGNIRQTVTNPDGMKVVTNSNNGKVITVQSIGADNSSGITVAYTYDEFNRQAGMTQTESGTTFTTSTMTYNAAGQPLTQTVNGRTNGTNGAILYISMTGNLLHINYSLWVFLLDKLDYG